MDRADEAGAAAAGAHFAELFNYVNASGDLGEWDSISADGCGFCSGVHDDVTDVYSKGNRYVGGNTTFDSAEVVGFDPVINVYAVQLRYTAEAATIQDADGLVLRVVDQDDGYLVLDVGFGASGWELLTGGARDEPVAR